MDLKQLRAVVAVGDHRSFSAAARALHTVQSNVSTHVARLEREVGAVLVDRSDNELTNEGRIVVARARRIEAEFAALESDVASLRDEVHGNVRVGSIGTTARWLVAPFLERLRERHPSVRTVILDATTSALIPQLVSGQIDLAVVNAPIRDVDVMTEDLFEEELVMVAPAHHPLAAASTLSLREIANHDLLLEAQGTAFRAELDEQASALGLELRAQAEVDGIRLLASLAFSGFGAAILPASAAPDRIDADWCRVPVTDLERRSVVLATRRRGMPSAAARAVHEVIVDVVEACAPSQPGIHPRSEITHRAP